MSVNTVVRFLCLLLLPLYMFPFKAGRWRVSGWGVLGVLASLIRTENWSASSLFSLFYGYEEGSNQDAKRILHRSQGR